MKPADRNLTRQLGALLRDDPERGLRLIAAAHGLFYAIGFGLGALIGWAVAR